MAEKIGLKAIFDDAQFRQAMRGYMGAINDAARETSNVASGMGRSWMSVGDGVLELTKKIGVGLVAAAGLAAAAVGALAIDGVNEAKGLEQAFADIAAVMDKTVDEIEPLRDLIRDLGLDPTLKVTTVEAANAIEMLAKNGVEMAAILDGAADSTITLANATGGDFVLAADIMTDAMNIFGSEIANSTDAIDAITSVVNNSKMTLNDYRFALANAGGVAQLAGVSFADFNVALSSIVPMFRNGRDAGTSFKVMLSSLEPKSGRAAEEMWRLGLITEETGNKFFTEAGEMRSMSEIFQVLQDATSGMSEQQRLASMRILFGTDAMRAAAAAASLGAEGFEEMRLEMEQTDAGRAMETRMSTLSGQLEILGGIIEAVKIAIGNAFIPMITEAVRTMQTWVDDAGPGIIGFFESIADWLGTWVPIAIAATADFFKNELLPAVKTTFVWIQTNVVPIVQEIIRWIGDALPKAIQWATDNWDKIKRAAMAFVAFLGAAGISSIIAGIVGAITTGMGPALIVIGLLSAAWGEWGDDILAWWETVRPVFEEFVSNVITWLQENVPVAIQTVSDFFRNTFLPAVQDVFGWIQENVLPIVQSLVQWIGEFLPIALQWAIENWDAIKRALMTFAALLAGAGIASIIMGIVGALTSGLAPVILIIAGLSAAWGAWGDDIIAFWNRVQPIIVEFAEKVGVWFTEKLDALREKWDEIGPVIMDFLNMVLTPIAEKFVEIANAIRDYVLAELDRFGAWWQEYQPIIEKAIQNLLIAWAALEAAFLLALSYIIPKLLNFWDVIQAVLEGVMDLVRDLVGTVATLLSGDFAGAWEDAKNMISNVWTNIQEIIDAALLFIVRLLGSNAESIDEWVEKTVETITRWSEDIVNWFEDTWETVRDAVVDWLAQIFTDIGQWAIDIVSAFNNWVSDWVQAGVNLVQGLIDGIGGMAGALMDRVRGMAADAWNALTSWLEESSPSALTEQAGQWFVEGFINGIDNMQPALEQSLENMAQTTLDYASDLADAAIGMLRAFNNINNADLDLVEYQLDQAGAALEEFQINLDDWSLGELQYLRMQASGPILDALNNYLGLYEEREQLEEAALERQEQMLILAQKQAQLNYMQQQLDLMNMLAERGLDPAALFEGMQFGLDASLDDMLALMDAAIGALINEANDQLGIGSPSKVFMAMGEIIGDSLTRGIEDSLAGQGLFGMPGARMMADTISRGIERTMLGSDVIRLPTPMVNVDGGSTAYNLHGTFSDNPIQVRSAFRLMERLNA